ncbi:MAG: class I SAM-dependent methyltransferase [Myxococcota bacterium]
MIWIGYTTRYREGGDKMARAARTMASEKRAQGATVRCEPVESKRAFRDAMSCLEAPLDELHLITHSGMYGPMFGTTDWPEQFSPHEWRTMALPFAQDGQAWFHACRSARWFAPFFARAFHVPTYGYHWYTTFSLRPDRFVWEGPMSDRDAPLYVVGAPGRKSHGLVGSVMKYGLGRAETPRRFAPTPDDQQLGSYDPVAEMYAEVFDDIRVRRDEWRWLVDRVPRGARVLDLGCGNGALVAQLSGQISSGVGVDVSAGQLAQARRRCSSLTNVSFQQIDGPQLPFERDRFDIAISLLSWRYLDWDPLLSELSRVLTGDGRLLIVDMAASPAKTREVFRLVVDRARGLASRWRHDGARAALGRMVSDARWQEMLRYNPIRAEHEYRWYLESRFPGARVELLNIGWNARMLAFDTGPFSQARLSEMQYP